MEVGSTLAARPLPMFVLCLVAGLSGCAVPYAEQVATLDAAPVCCKELSELKYEKLSASEARDIPLSEGSQAFVFPTGKSFVGAFELPPFLSSYQIIVSTQPRRAGNDDGTIVRPLVLLLDASYKRTRSVDHLPYRASAGGALIREFFVNPANSQERFLVVYTNPNGTEKYDVTTYTPMTVAVGAVPLTFDGRQASHSVRNAAAGQVSLTLKPYEPSRVGEP
jgi:hypothetical protein